MGGRKVRIIGWTLGFGFLWVFGCSWFQPNAVKEKPPVKALPPKSVEAQIPSIVKQVDKEPKKISPPTPPEVKFYTHTVKWSGETIIRLSRWYTGSGNNWLRLIEANPSIDPRRIKIGDTILIPENLLTTREPLPISYLSSSIEQTQESSSTSERAPARIEEVELFGPIDTGLQTGRLDATDSPLPLDTIE
jgi:hypothetical protein